MGSSLTLSTNPEGLELSDFDFGVQSVLAFHATAKTSNPCKGKVSGGRLDASTARSGRHPPLPLSLWPLLWRLFCRAFFCLI